MQLKTTSPIRMNSSLIIFNLKKNFSGDNCISEAAGDRRDVSPHDYWQGDHHHHQDHYYYDIDYQVIANYGPKRKKNYPKSIHLIGTGNIEVRWDMRRQILMMGNPHWGFPSLVQIHRYGNGCK